MGGQNSDFRADGTWKNSVIASLIRRRETRGLRCTKGDCRKSAKAFAPAIEHAGAKALADLRQFGSITDPIPHRSTNIALFMISRDRALALLTQCSGETIWPADLCREKRIPEPWIEELADAFESSFDQDRDTIYLNEKQTNQFHGIRDVDLAAKIGESLGIDVGRLQRQSLGRSALVAAIKEAVMEG